MLAKVLLSSLADRVSSVSMVIEKWSHISTNYCDKREEEGKKVEKRPKKVGRWRDRDRQAETARDREQGIKGGLYQYSINK